MWRTVRNALERCLERTAGEQAQDTRALQLACAALLVEVSRADAVVGVEEERARLDALRRAYGLDEAGALELMEEAEALADRAVSLSDFTQVLREHLGREQRVRVVELLWQVAWADGRIDRYEDYWVRKISDLLYVAHADFIRAKLRTQPAAPESQPHPRPPTGATP